MVHLPIARGTFRVSNRKEKYFIHYSVQIFYTHEFVRTVSGSIKPILVFCIFRWFISWTQQSWVWYWWSPVEPLDVFRVLCPSVRELQRILDVCQSYTKSHGIIFNCSNTICMTFKARPKKHGHPVADTGVRRVKSIFHYKYLGIALDVDLSDDKDFQRQLRYQYVVANKLRASFTQFFELSEKCTFSFLLYIHVCITIMVQFQEDIHPQIACGLWLWLQGSVAYTFRGERVSVVIRFSVTFVPLRPYCEKMFTCFLNDGKSPKIHGCALWCSQIVYIRPSLSTTTPIYFMTECPVVPVMVARWKFQ